MTTTVLSIFHTISKCENSVQNGGGANLCQMIHARQSSKKGLAKSSFLGNLHLLSVLKSIVISGRFVELFQVTSLATLSSYR